MYMTPEEQARQKIDGMLLQAGWSYRTEMRAAGADRAGFADYVLYDADGTAVALLEAKAAAKTRWVGKEQAREYAASLGVGYVMLSNGEQHYLWDTRAGDPVRTLAIPPAGDRSRRHERCAPRPLRTLDNPRRP